MTSESAIRNHGHTDQAKAQNAEGEEDKGKMPGERAKGAIRPPETTFF